MNFCFTFRTAKFLWLMIFFPAVVFGQADLVGAINKKLIPLRSIENIDDLSDLASLKSILKDKNIIALGEATHGTHEFFTMKHHVVEFLIKEMGFRVFTIEADFAGTQSMNDYVLNGVGTPLQALQKMGIGVWLTKEFVSMVEWIKVYNATQPNDKKVVFYGCDMQWAINSGPYLIDGTVKFKTPLSEDAVKGINAAINFRYGQIDKSQVELLNTAARELSNAVILENDSSKSIVYKRYISSVLQTIQYAKAKYLYDKDVIRDKAMAENCEWIYEHEHQHKMIVWAHNLHISREITKNNNLPMGSYLSKKFGGGYYAIGFGFNKGEFRAYNTELKKYTNCVVPDVTSKHSIEFIFKQCDVPNFILDFQSSSDVGLISDFLSEKLNSRAIGGGYDPQKRESGGWGAEQSLNKMYDALIFINQTTASLIL
jgi:erythromycin esterase